MPILYYLITKECNLVHRILALLLKYCKIKPYKEVVFAVLRLLRNFSATLDTDFGFMEPKKLQKT